MKKILMALTIAGLTYCGAEAQDKSCEVTQTKVCAKGRDCYNTKYAENFKVCKGNAGYFICCETPGRANATHPAYTVGGNTRPAYEAPYNTYYPMQNEATDQVAASTAPQSQSYNTDYGMNNARSYQGYYPKGKIRVCYTGDNVAEDTRAPYEGCASPQYDGPDLNKERNVNVVTPVED